MAQDIPSDPAGPPPLPQPPFILLPQNKGEGVSPVFNMLNSDLRLQTKFPTGGDDALGWHPPMALPPAESGTAPNMCMAQDFALQSPANLLMPKPPAPGPSETLPEPEAEEDGGWDWSVKGASRGTKDVGVRTGAQTGIREYIRSGYTRRNPNGTSWDDNDWAGKWKDDFTIASVGGKSDFLFSETKEELGSFGEDGDLFSGEASALNASSTAEASFKVTSEGATGKLGADVKGSLIEGKIESDDEQVISAGASGSAVSGKAEASAELVVKDDQFTLGGELGAEVNLIEGKIEGDIHITPKRVVDLGINAWNYVMDDDVEELSDNWDIGVTIGGELSGQIGAQASAEARGGYEKGKLRAEAGAKIGAGIGGGVKVRGGIVGLDKVGSAIKKAWDWVWSD